MAKSYRLVWEKRLNRPASIEIQAKLGGSTHLLRLPNLFPERTWVHEITDAMELRVVEPEELRVLSVLAKFHLS